MFFDPKEEAIILKHIQSVIIFVSLLIFLGCGEKEVVISGKTMGTTYHVKAITKMSETELKEKIEKRLEDINKSMSTFRKDSEISQFNAIRSVTEKFNISNDFMEVMIVAKDIYQKTNGAWDGTIYPLIKLWGFGGGKIIQNVPNDEDIKRLLNDVGFHFIHISEEKYLKKDNENVMLDLASIAKGYGVDQIAVLLEKNGIKNFIVEIGGEVFAMGVKKDQTPWMVGINMPQKTASPDEIYKKVILKNQAMATSGDYRNFFEINGKRYSHILDPKTGYPVSNGVVSATVIADSCTYADGLATALMVMGPEKGVALVNQLEDVECLIIVQEQDGKFKEFYSTNFQVVP